MKRFVGSVAVMALIGLFSWSVVWGQTVPPGAPTPPKAPATQPNVPPPTPPKAPVTPPDVPATPPKAPVTPPNVPVTPPKAPAEATEKKQPETVQPNRSLKDESWYAIIFNGERVGSMHTTVEEVVISGQDNAPAQKSYVFLRELFSANAALLPYLKLNEEMQFNAADMIYQKSIIKMSLADKRELTLKGIKEGSNLKFSATILVPSPSGEPVPQTSVQEFKGKENFYSEQALGLLLLSKNWEVNKSYPLKLISPYNPNNLFVDAQFFIKEKTTQKIMGVMTEGYLCSLTILDLASTVEEMEYFIGLNGVMLKQSTGNLVIIKSTKEESVTQDSNKRVFERKGRVDPFMQRLTPIVGGGRPLSGDDIAKAVTGTQGAKITDALLNEAREQLQLMKDIYAKAPEVERDRLLVVPYQIIPHQIDRKFQSRPYFLL